MRTLVKFCGLTRAEDVLSAAAAGADYLGFVLVPGSLRCLDQAQLPALLAAVPAGLPTVFVTADLPLPELQRLIAAFRPAVVQLHGQESPDYARAIRGAAVWKAVPLTRPQQIEQFAGFPAEYLVADAARGGSGRCCDWELAAQLADRWKIFLAGGLGPGNAAAALRCCPAAGIDACSGIERSPGQKDPEKMRLFMRAVRSGDILSSEVQRVQSGEQL